MAVITVLGRSVGTSGFPGALVRALRDAARRTREIDRGGYLGGRVSALNDLADHVEFHVTPDEPLICALHAIRGAFGDSDTFDVGELGEHQGMIYSGVGMNAGGPIPEPEVLLRELVLAGVLDMLDTYGAKAIKDTQKLARQETEIVALTDRAESAEAELATVRTELDTVHAAHDELVEEARTLRELLPGPAASTENNGSPSESAALSSGSGSGGSSKEARKRERRAKTEHAGVYRTERADGSTVYEIKAAGQPWQTVGTDLDAAIRAREEAVAK